MTLMTALIVSTVTLACHNCDTHMTQPALSGLQASCHDCPSAHAPFDHAFSSWSSEPYGAMYHGQEGYAPGGCSTPYCGLIRRLLTFNHCWGVGVILPRFYAPMTPQLYSMGYPVLPVPRGLAGRYSASCSNCYSSSNVILPGSHQFAFHDAPRTVKKMESAAELATFSADKLFDLGFTAFWDGKIHDARTYLSLAAEKRDEALTWYYLALVERATQNPTAARSAARFAAALEVLAGKVDPESLTRIQGNNRIWLNQVKNEIPDWATAQRVVRPVLSETIISVNK